MKLLGKEVKVGTRVMTSHDDATVVYIEGQCGKDYPFKIKKTESGEEYFVAADGRYLIGETDLLRDIVEILCDYAPPIDTDNTSDAQFAAMEQTATELELKNYRLSLENELLSQEVQELREGNASLNKRIDRLEAELTAFASSRDVWQDLSKKYRRILRGGS